MVTLTQVKNAMENLIQYSGDKNIAIEQLCCAIDAAKDALKSMDDLTVKGRDNVDVLLGCMMALDSIIGEAK